MKAKNIITIVSLAAAFVLLFQDAIAHIFRSFSTLGGAHGPLIICVSLYLVWMNRQKLRDLRPEPAIISGGLLLAVGCFSLFAGKIGSTIVVQQLSMIPFLLGAVLLLAGFAWFKVFLLPVGYLIFLTGMIEHLLGNFAIYLQKITAWISVMFMKIIGFQVFHEGTLIMLPHVTLEVARVCSGIGHIVTLMALAVPLAIMTQKTVSRKIILIVSSLFIGVFVNGLRILMIGIYTYYKPGVNVHGPYELLYSSFIFFFGLLILILFSRVLTRKDKNNASRDQSESASIYSSSSMITNQKSFSHKRIASIFVGAVIISTTLIMVQFYKPEPLELDLPLNLFPDHIAGFTARDLDQVHERIRPFPADEELMRVYKDIEGNSIEVYIGYFRIQDRESKIIDWRRSWMHEEVSRVEVNAANTLSVINKTRLRQQSINSDIYFWYQMDGRVITNEYAGKFFTFMDSLLKRKNNAAVIIIKTRSSDDQVMPFLEEAVPLIQTHLSEGKTE